MAFSPDGQPLRDTLDTGANWTVAPTFTVANFSGGAMVGPGSASIMLWTGAAYFAGADVEVWATLGSAPVAGETMTLGGRYIDTANRYTVRLAAVAGSSNDTMALEAAGAPIVGPTSVGFDWGAGDVVAFRCAKDRIEAWYKHSGTWTQFANVIDSTHSAAGSAFLGFGSSGSYVDFGGGDHLATPEGMTGLQ